MNKTTMNTNANTTKKDTYGRTLTDDLTIETNISLNKIEVMLDRYRELKGTEIERIVRTLASCMAESDNHMTAGDQYFNYSQDKVDAKIEIDLFISAIYKKEGNITEIGRSIYFRNAKAKSEELSDHYWAIPHNN